MGGHSMRGSAYSCWNGISVHRVFGNGSCCACYVSEICHRICNLAFSLHFEKIGKVGSLDTEVQAWGRGVDFILIRESELNCFWYDYIVDIDSRTIVLLRTRSPWRCYHRVCSVKYPRHWECCRVSYLRREPAPRASARSSTSSLVACHRGRVRASVGQMWCPSRAPARTTSRFANIISRIRTGRWWSGQRGRFGRMPRHLGFRQRAIYHWISWGNVCCKEW